MITANEHNKLLIVERGKHSFGANHVLHDVNLTVHAGQFVSLVGPSGCGKSTLLNAIVGTHPLQEGRVSIRAEITWTDYVQQWETITKPGRDRGIVYQRYSLMPFLTARQNVALGLILDRSSPLSRCLAWRWWRQKVEYLDRAEELLTRVGLKDAVNKYPSQLSGGMRQRVAIAQALIMQPRLLLLDEPFGALDEAMREELQKMLLVMYQENLRAVEKNQPPLYTLIIVTHELNEAIYVGDRVVGLSQHWNWKPRCSSCPGAIIVYDQPAPVFSPDEPKDAHKFIEQRLAIRAALEGERWT